MKGKNLKWVSSIILGLLSTIGFVAANGEIYHGPGMMGWMYGGYGISFFIVIIWVLVIVALILLVVWLIKQISKK
nr:hypothetical protein [Nanoarchaeota archaeon]